MPIRNIRKKTTSRSRPAPTESATESHTGVDLPTIRSGKETISSAARRMNTTRSNLQVLHEQGRLMWDKKTGRISVVRMPSDDKKEELRDEQMQRVKEQVKRLQIANAKELGQLVSAKEVEKQLQNILALFRQRLLAFPRRLSSRLVSLSERDIEDALSADVADLLENLGVDAKKVLQKPD